MKQLLTLIAMFSFTSTSMAVDHKIQVKDHVSKELRTFVPATSPYHLQKVALPETVACYSYETDKGEWVDLHLMCGQKDMPGYAVRVSCNKNISNKNTATLHLYPAGSHTHSIAIQCEQL